MRLLGPAKNKQAQPSQHGQWRNVIAPGSILLVALALRLLRLGDANLWWDEALAVWAVRKGLAGATLWTAGDVHPPLFFWSLWSWVQFAGESEFALRFLSVIFGVLTVAVVYRLGYWASGRAVGLLAAIFTAIARFHIWWSQELRMYVLAGLLGLLALYLFLRWLDAERNTDENARRVWSFLIAYIFCAAGSLYTIFLMGALLLAQNLVVLILLIWPMGYQRGRLLARWCGAQLVILALLAIWLSVSWGRMPTWSVAEPFGVAAFMQLMTALLTTGVSVHIEQVAWAAILPFWVLAAGAILGLRIWQRRQSPPTQTITALTLALSFVLPPIIIYLSTMPRGLFYTPKIEARYFAPFAPVFWILLAWSVALIARRTRLGLPIGSAVLAIWIGFLPGHYSSRYLRDELQTMTQTIISQAQPGDAVLLDSGGRYPVFLYYYEREGHVAYRPPMVTITQAEGLLSADQVASALRHFEQDYQRIWLAEVDVHLTDPGRLAQEWLRSHYKEALAKRYGHNALYLYAHDATPPKLTPSYIPQHFANTPTQHDGILRGWELPVTRFTGGTTAYISLLWERLPNSAVSVALRDQHGQIVFEQSHDAEASSRENQRQQFDLLIPGHLANGNYDILLSPAPVTGAALGRLHVSGNTIVAQNAKPRVQVNARMGQDITLLGYTIQGANRSGRVVEAGGELILDLYWRAEHKPGRDLTVFTHLLGATFNPKTQGPLWGQHDAQPMDNRFPTGQWREGQIVVDRHVIPVDGDTPAGEYQVEVGMYVSEDGRRLDIIAQDGQSLGDHLVLNTPIHVKAR